MGRVAFVPFPGYIEVAVATAVLLNILLTVEARTKYIPVLSPVAGSEAAGAGHVSIAGFVDEQITDYAQRPLTVAVEEISLRLKVPAPF
jgi:hypothetical protein